MKWIIIGLAILFGIPATALVGYFAVRWLRWWFLGEEIPD